MDSSSLPDETHENDNPTPQSKMKKKTSTRKRKEASSKTKESTKRKTRSAVWDHFTRTEDDEDICTCNYCHNEYGCDTSKGTSSLSKHLTKCNQYQLHEENSQHKGKVISKEGRLQEIRVSESVFREATNELMVLAQLPLSFVESLAWKRFCERIHMYTPHSRRTATRDIVEMFVKRKKSLKSWISSHKQRVSLTTDIWVCSPTQASYMVITLHFIDPNWQLQKLIIGFKYVADHKGATIANCLLNCLAEWGIEKIFTVTVDNATANTSALRKFQREFASKSNEAFVLGGDYMHVRCAAHIINLIVKDGVADISESVEAVRNGVRYVRGSSRRMQSFETKVDEQKITRGSLPKDVPTRWNSTFLMLQKAVKFRRAFDKMQAEDKLYNDYFNEVEDGKKRIGPPSGADWREVERLNQFLIMFYNATKIVSASTVVSSYRCYGEIVSIEKALVKMHNDVDKKLASKADEMRAKFDKYWEGMKNMNKLVIIASIFDPTMKFVFAKMCFDKLYGKDSAQSKEMYTMVYGVLSSLFQEYMSRAKSSQQSGQQSTQSNQTTSSNYVVRDPVDEDFGYERMHCSYQEIFETITHDTASNELEIYLNEQVVNPKTMVGCEFDVLSWWKVNSGKFPIMSEIARDILAMQVSSVASESAFSTSGRLVSPYRSNLTHYMVEVLMSLEQWVRNDIKMPEKTFESNADLLTDFELQDGLEREFGSLEEDVHVSSFM